MVAIISKKTFVFLPCVFLQPCILVLTKADPSIVLLVYTVYQQALSTLDGKFTFALYYIVHNAYQIININHNKYPST